MELFKLQFSKLLVLSIFCLQFLTNCKSQPNESSNSEPNLNASVRSLAEQPDFFFRKDVKRFLKKDGFLDVELYLASFSSRGVFTMNYVIPVVRDFPDSVRFEIYYEIPKKKIDKVNSAPFDSLYNEIKLQLTIKELFQESYYDYLLMKSEFGYTKSWKEISRTLGLSISKIEKYIQSENSEKLIELHQEKVDEFKKRNSIDYIPSHLLNVRNRYLMDGYQFFLVNTKGK